MSAKKMTRLDLGLLSLSILFLLASPVHALQNRERIRENISTLRLLRMTQALDLTEEQTAKVYPVYNRIEKDKIEIQKRIGYELDELRKTLKDEAPKEAEIETRIKNLMELRNELKSKDDEFEMFLDSNLTLVQRAKYVLFSIDFYRGLGEKLNRARMIPERVKRNF
jgi:Spy/CpxP family protein refolding chaperone